MMMIMTDDGRMNDDETMMWWSTSVLLFFVDLVGGVGIWGNEPGHKLRLSRGERPYVSPSGSHCIRCQLPYFYR